MICELSSVIFAFPVVIIEHHLDVIKTADHVIDLGPGGGHPGGAVIACGTPEEVARAPGSHTGRYLAEVLGQALANYQPVVPGPPLKGPTMLAVIQLP
jgi:hypothetical protein